MNRLSKRMRPPAAYPRRLGQGLSLVELMVAIAIGLFMVGALITLFVNNSAARVELDRSSRQIENGRFAIDVLRDDIAMSGYFGELAPPERATVVNPQPCATATADMGWNASTGSVPAPVQGPSNAVGGSTLAFTNCTAAALNQRAGTGFLVLRRLRPQTETVAAAVSNAHYLQINGCLTGTVPFAFNTASAGGFTLQGADCATAATLRRYESRLYYVADCGVCSPSDGIPTLKLRELVNSAMVERVIADGIEDLQFEFGLDTNNDGVPDSYATAGAATDWPNVVAVRIHVISRATSATPGYADDKAYTRGAFGSYSVPAGAEQFKRRYYTTVVHMPNSSGPRERP